VTAFADFLEGPCPSKPPESANLAAELAVGLVAAAISLAGIFHRLPVLPPEALPRRGSRARAGPLESFWKQGWGFDWLYDRAFVRPFLWAARAGKDDLLDLVFTLARGSRRP